MNSFKKLFQKSHDDRTPSLKHSKSMTYGLSSQGSTRDPRADPVKPTYRGKTPLKTSDIVYIEQAPGVLDIRRAQDLRDLTPPRAHFDTYADLLDQFPNPPPPPPRPPRSALRTTSLNSKNSRPQPPLQNCNTSYQHVAGRQRTIQRRPSVACFSRPTATAYSSLVRKQQHETTDDQAVTSVLQTGDDQVCVVLSGRHADYVRVNSSAGRSHTSAPVPPACPIPTTHSQRPPISHSAYSSRTNLRRVPSRITIPRIAAPDHGQSYRPHNDYRDFLREQDPNVISAMINSYPKAPHDDSSQEPILFNMEDPSDFRKTLSYFIYLALAQGCPLDARADGSYRRIMNAADPTGIAPEVGADWSQQVGNR